ncbi:MAG: thioredoxin domain-containing protein [Acidobacteria bacterium]|nr:thioredoxin domain-containing protein [Acidobacteriota bacterium]
MSMLRVPVSSQDHVQGEVQAEITLVEYGDYECPHCAHAHPIVKRVQKHFGKRLRFVFRNFPLTQIHPQAQSAAEATEFAAAHGHYWEMHDRIFENQARLSAAFLLELAESLGMAAPDLRNALAEERYAAVVKNDFLGGVRSGVNGTPTFFINGYRHDGPFEYADLVSAIEARAGK